MLFAKKALMLLEMDLFNMKILISKLNFSPTYGLDSLTCPQIFSPLWAEEALILK